VQSTILEAQIPHAAEGMVKQAQKNTLHIHIYIKCIEEKEYLMNKGMITVF
jgi:hypothetical protein